MQEIVDVVVEVIFRYIVRNSAANIELFLLVGNKEEKIFLRFSEPPDNSPIAFPLFNGSG